MIELVRSEYCSQCDAVQLALDEMVVAYRVTVVDGAPEDVPIIRDGDRVVGREDVDAYLKELSHFVTEWGKFQSDACYVNEDSTVC